MPEVSFKWGPTGETKQWRKAAAIREEGTGEQAAASEERLVRAMWRSKGPFYYALKQGERIPEEVYMSPNEVKNAVIGYLQRTKDCPLVTLEFSWDTDSVSDARALADVAAVDPKGLFIEVEVKVSVSDLRADREKELKHLCLRGSFDAQEPMPIPCFRLGTGAVPARFYYAVPVEMSSKARKFIKEHFPYAGLMEVSSPTHLRVVRPAPAIHNAILDPKAQHEMMRSLSWRHGNLFSKQLGVMEHEVGIHG